MARSPLTLQQWFEAIRLALWRPTMTTAELARKLGIKRPTTVRAVARKIREALASDDPEKQLAGLNRHFASRPRET